MNDMDTTPPLELHDDADLRHLIDLSTRLGIFEHCDGVEPRREHGFCTDDNARLLMLAAHAQHHPEADLLVRRSLEFLEGAHVGQGRFADRRAADGTWLDAGVNDDACGRALWGLGTAAALLDDPHTRRRARLLFEDAAAFRSPWLRSTAFAVLGAGAVLERDPGAGAARELINDAAESTGRVAGSDAAGWRSRWPWPEERLTYANAVVPHMMLTIARETGDHRFTLSGFNLLRWLVDTETSKAGHLSVTPSGGWSVGERRPAFDQQPIEVATLADCAITAWSLTGEHDWLELLGLCTDWFHGENDLGVPMIDRASGGGFDGLTPNGPNTNQGAESTIAALTTRLHAQRLLTPALS